MRFHKIAVLILVICIVLSALLLSACGRKSSLEPQLTASIDAKLGLHITKATGEQKYIVVLADFPDVKRQYPEKTISDRLIGRPLK